MRSRFQLQSQAATNTHWGAVRQTNTATKWRYLDQLYSRKYSPTLPNSSATASVNTSYPAPQEVTHASASHCLRVVVLVLLFRSRAFKLLHLDPICPNIAAPELIGLFRCVVLICHLLVNPLLPQSSLSDLDGGAPAAALHQAECCVFVYRWRCSAVIHCCCLSWASRHSYDWPAFKKNTVVH